jgi:hypothetical protein
MREGVMTRFAIVFVLVMAAALSSGCRSLETWRMRRELAWQSQLTMADVVGHAIEHEEALEAAMGKEKK